MHTVLFVVRHNILHLAFQTRTLFILVAEGISDNGGTAVRCCKFTFVGPNGSVTLDLNNTFAFSGCDNSQ